MPIFTKDPHRLLEYFYSYKQVFFFMREMRILHTKQQMKQKQRVCRGHVLVVTYPSQGHINPLLQFAKRLASKGVKVSFATTHYTIKCIDAHGVQVEPISDGFDEGGFKQAPDTNTYIESLKTVGSRTLSELVMKLGDLGCSVNCIVYDSFLPWALDVARQHGAVGAAFLTNSAAVCSVYWHVNHGLFQIPVEQEAMPFCLPGLPPFGSSDIPGFLLSPASYPAYLAVVMNQFSNLEEADWVFANTFEDLESQVAKVMSTLWPVKMIGPMVPSAYLDKGIEGDISYGANLWNPATHECLKWLGSRPPMSVVHVSFGSMAELGAKQIEEISFGLKENAHHFIWVLRECEHVKLPPGFIDSSKEKGLVLTWCNQLEILVHDAIGCFVTHCGWNSTLEGLSLGVPMVGVPQWSDQPTNAKFVEDVWQVGVRAKVDGEGVVRRDELRMCIDAVMAGERSKEIQRNAQNWKESAKRAISEGGSSYTNIDQFVAKLLND